MRKRNLIFLRKKLIKLANFVVKIINKSIINDDRVEIECAHENEMKKEAEKRRRKNYIKLHLIIRIAESLQQCRNITVNGSTIEDEK